MSFEFIIETAKKHNLVYTIYDYEAFFVPMGMNYFTRIRNFGSDYYIEYCDDYRKPLDNKVIVVRRRDNMPIKPEIIIVHHILEHPKNKHIYTHFDECMKILDKQFTCDLIENEAFVSIYDKNHYTKMTAKEDRIATEYLNENFVLLKKSDDVMNTDKYDKMVETLKDIIYCHPMN